jgi:hypothetical protein
MKYTIGDVIKVKSYMNDYATVYHSRIAVITDVCNFKDELSVFHYEVIISGIEERKYFVHEDDIVEKL